MYINVNNYIVIIEGKFVVYNICGLQNLKINICEVLIW